MFSYILSFFNYLFPKSSEEDHDTDEDQEHFLSEQLLDLELLSEKDCYNIEPVIQEIPRNVDCFQRSGVITYINYEYVLIDGIFYFDTTACSIKLNLNDRVIYLGYKNANDSIVVARILENNGTHWGNTDDVEETHFNVIEHVIIGEVDRREERFVYIKDSDLKFCLDNVHGIFIPIKGDWLELLCTMQWDENKPSDISTAQVLQVDSFKPLRSKVKSVLITEWDNEVGTCDKNIYFNKHSIVDASQPAVGSKVMIEAIESNQGLCTWRAIKMIVIENHKNNTAQDIEQMPNEEDISLEIEKTNSIEFTNPIKFKFIDINSTAKITATIKNNNNQPLILNKWIILGKKRDSQVNINPFISKPYKIYPNQSFNFTITCKPKFLGTTKECLVVMFREFQLKRLIEINVVDKYSQNSNAYSCNQSTFKSESDKIDNMRKIRRFGANTFVPGVRPTKPPAFIPVKLGQFPIPEKIWSAVLGDSEQTIHSSEFNKILYRIESNLPCLIQELNIHNYTDKWHTLLYMEEIQANISMRAYDMQKAFLMRCQEYLGIEIKGLSEKRPSLIKGDRVIVTDVWDSNTPNYEGYIHTIKGDLVLIKFNQQFHESYSGSDVSVEFHFTRTIYRRSHQAINLALSNLGPSLLFPTRTSVRPPYKIQEIEWCNKMLNFGQKAAVHNILLGECRPMPYCIYGPPGTGKTVTVIETILQILKQFPDSRILVATPSNSASNLITERLLQYKDVIAGSMIRLIANYLLDSDTIPDLIKPFCATLDIARENTAKSKYNVTKDGINVSCRTSFVGRHRVTIGTCYCIGTLAQMGLPKGHFTHVIIDEAGQATEPEIMIPMTFVDKDSGQIILAGDPMQLGPVIMSKYCKEYGMDESYLSRILSTFPYQKDFDAFENGFDNKLVTKLNDNYRSLEEVLRLPSEMFYDGTLVPRINRTEPWIKKFLDVVADIYEIDGNKFGGIFVYGIRGRNARAQDSPSWFNPEEASMIALTTCKLYKKEVTCDDIGIITPYVAQIKYLRLLFDSMGLLQPKIGTVEEFQGQERPIILISTVRSTESLLQDDFKHTLGFVKNPKRLNVALTRAQLAVLLFCNPHLLCKDPLWHRVISQSVVEDKYMGCDLPIVYNNPILLK